MTTAQIGLVLSDIGGTNVGFRKWFQPKEFSYVVLKDNSILYIGESEFWYLDDTDGLLYVATGIYNMTTKQYNMPTTGFVAANTDRVNKVIDFENFNHISLRFNGDYLGLRRGV